MQDKKNEIPTYIFALGGLEEIGKNTYVIEHDDEIFVFDAGVKFANDEMLGMNGTVANFTFLKENEENFKGLVITHGHEDHIGGIVHLLRKIKVPVIYAPKLPAELIKKKISEHKDITMPKIVEVDDDSVIKGKYMEIDFCRVCHSIPDSFMVCVKTPNGNIVSTGDFRFDFATNGDETNLKKLMEFSSRGIDVLLCESTSSEVPGFSESEKYIINNLRTMIINALGRVFISTFASNLGRVEEIIDLSVRLGRKIVILGKSMEENVKISRKIGYLNVDDEYFISPKDIGNYNDNEILVILTGSQGEELAALNVMSKGEHSKITLKPSDTIILSSNPIPGNYESVERLINNLYKQGVKIIENRPEHKIHASGHATRSEQQLMIKAIDPKFIFPIHGEYKMLRCLQANAVDLGFDHDKVLITINGHKLQLLNGELSYTNIHVPAVPMYIDGKSVSSSSLDLIKERKVLSDNGVVHVSVYLNEDRKSLATIPAITTRGCFFTKTSTNFLYKFSQNLHIMIDNKLKEMKEYDEKYLISCIHEETVTNIWRFKKKNPEIFVSVFIKDPEQEKSFISKYPRPTPAKNNEVRQEISNEINEPDSEN